jgi:prevent-host-death family protein
MGIEIGSFKAKTKLSELLRSVSRGKRYTITLRGKPVADLVPTEAAAKSDPGAAVAAMRSIRQVKGISGDTIAAWIAEGRK